MQSHSCDPKLVQVFIDNESHSEAGLKRIGFEVTPDFTLDFLISVWFLVHHAPPLASVKPAVASSVHASPGSSPIFPIMSIIVPFLIGS